MALLSNYNNRNSDLIELNKDSFNTPSFDFNIPMNKQSSIGINSELFNKKKISDDVISMSSGSSNGSSSGGKKNYMKNIFSLESVFSYNFKIDYTQERIYSDFYNQKFLNMVQIKYLFLNYP